MAPQHTAVITGSASRRCSRSDWSHAGHQRWQHLHWLDSQELRNPLSATSCAACRKIGRSPPRALYGERSECNDQPQRSGYVQVARVDSSPGKWWVWSEFLLRARRCSEADRRRDANLSRPCSQRRHNAHQPIAARTTYTMQQAPNGAAPTATDTGYSRLGSRPATLTRGRKQ